MTTPNDEELVLYSNHEKPPPMQFYRIISYYIDDKRPTKYPISLSVEEEIVFAPYAVERACLNNQRAALAASSGNLYCAIVQNFEIDDGGKFVLCDEEIRYFPSATNGVEEKKSYGRFAYGDIIEVIDDDRLTLGIVVHVPLQAHINMMVAKPHLLYRYAVLLYKPNGRIVLEDVPPTHLLHFYTLSADTQIAALRTASENICVQE